MTRIKLMPDDIKPYGKDDAKYFYLIINSRLKKYLSIEPTEKYQDCTIIQYDGDFPFTDLLESDEIKQQSHILTILPDCLLHSIPRETLGKRKILIMACKSGQTEIDGIEHFLNCGINTDPAEHQKFSDLFFDKGQESELFILKDKINNAAEAKFVHLNNDYDWHEQLGFLDWGDQQVFPSGEIACFLVPLYTENLPDRTFELDGEIIITGPIIVQSGPPSFRIEDQKRIYDQLSKIKRGIQLTIEHGIINSIVPISEEDSTAANMLNALIKIDSRYANIYEIGFSINKNVSVWPGNTAMNEVWGENGGKGL